MKYGDIISEKAHITSKLNRLSGINLFKKQNNEYIK